MYASHLNLYLKLQKWTHYFMLMLMLYVKNLNTNYIICVYVYALCLHSNKIKHLK